MKILHINSYYSGSSFYKNLYEKQIKNGLDIDVYVPVSTSVDESCLNLGNYTTISKNHYRHDRILFHIKHNKIYKDVVKKYSIDKYSIIHAHSLFSNGYIAYKLYKEYNIPYIVAVRNTDVNLFFKKMIHLRALGVKILKNAKKIIFISEPYKEYTINNYIPNRYRQETNDKSIVIPNGIDKFWYDNKVEEVMIPSKNIINIVYVGILDENKNIETTTKACEILIGLGYKVNYKIIGRVTNEKYNDFMSKYSFIEYIPHCKKEELLNHYRSSDLFVMPSKHETFGLVYAEAMSQGLPVIYTRGQGFDGQFEEGEVGYSVKCDSAEEIVAKIIETIDNYEEISKRCIDLCGNFDWEVIAGEYINVYSKIIDNNS